MEIKMLIKKYHAYKILSKIIAVVLIILLILSVTLTLLIVRQSLLSKQIAVDQESDEVRVEKFPNDAKYNRTKVDYESDLNNYLNKTRDVSNYKNTITIVSAYFNLGTFQKGDQETYTTSLYKKWLRVFLSITNPVVFYTDSKEIYDYFAVLRQHLPKYKTKIILINRDTLWAFSIEKQIGYIFSQVGYPKHHPNTIIPAYSCSMHAKYELLRKTIIENPCKTKYIAWLDLGLFRDLAGDSNPVLKSKKLKKFGLKIPNDFNEENIGYTEVHQRNEDFIPIDIIYSNLVWVCGCFFLGRMDVMFRWTAEYIEGVNWLIRKKLMNTDQQIIYTLANSQLIKTQIQTYKDFKGHSWFYLGYLCRETWLKDKMFSSLARNLN